MSKAEVKDLVGKKRKINLDLYLLSHCKVTLQVELQGLLKEAIDSIYFRIRMLKVICVHLNGEGEFE